MKHGRKKNNDCNEHRNTSTEEDDDSEDQPGKKKTKEIEKQEVGNKSITLGSKKDRKKQRNKARTTAQLSIMNCHWTSNLVHHAFQFQNHRLLWMPFVILPKLINKRNNSRSANNPHTSTTNDNHI